ncbi:MAG TPA: hypothetical protein VLE22_14055 [Bryobacteraceae bacterium]|nr:hypothetical protein [Bryobacteraceae bacterium]
MTELPSCGPLVIDNWRASGDSQEPPEVLEYPLFTDAWMTGGTTAFGPYELFNTIAHAGMPRDSLKPALVLRVQYHFRHELPSMEKTNVGSYHGGELQDEVAALVSLVLGIRLKAGPASREFPPHGSDPRGVPIAYYGFREPVLITNSCGRMLPNALGAHSLDSLKRFPILPELTQSDGTALVRSARLYQESVWIAESDPAMAWLLMVSAVECAAHRWDQRYETPVERLRASRPDLAKILEERCPDLIDEVALRLVESLGATQKFVKFLLRFLPEPPPARPPVTFRVQWTSRQLKRILSMVYKYRSQALHAGIPFPAPMCEPPRRVAHDWPAPPEKPLGLAASARGGVWVAKDVPLHLHVFEYLARGALLNWWQSLTGQNP